MKLLSLALLTLAAAGLAGCGAAGCNSFAADIAASGQSCAVRPGTVTVSVPVNCRCTDTSASCQAEFLGGQLEVAATVQQCDDQQGCDTQGCDITGRTATCDVVIPAGFTGSATIVDGSGNTIGVLNAGADDSCVL